MGAVGVFVCFADVVGDGGDWLVWVVFVGDELAADEGDEERFDFVDIFDDLFN